VRGYLVAQNKTADGVIVGIKRLNLNRLFAINRRYNEGFRRALDTGAQQVREE
jgi:hypothetical protein